MKKIATVFLIIVMLLSATACSNLINNSPAGSGETVKNPVDENKANKTDTKF